MNIWVVSCIVYRIFKGVVIYFGILNSFRFWNFFELLEFVILMFNVGGFGIDGGFLILFGVLLVSFSKFYFGIIGDLVFFYDMNVFGNCYIGNNLCIMVVNNGKGIEFW